MDHTVTWKHNTSGGILILALMISGVSRSYVFTKSFVKYEEDNIS